MAIRVYKKTSHGRQNASVNLNSEVTRTQPEKTLLRRNQKHAGRNHQGRITQQGRGGGHKRRFRVIDFQRNKDDQAAKVVGIEYDPNRSAHIALIEYPDAERRYILAPRNLTDGDQVVSSQRKVEANPGNCMPLRFVPAGLTVYNIEMSPGRGGQMCRSAGNYARLTNREGRWATLLFPSGEIRQVAIDCRATIGQVSNSDHSRVVIGKAGRNRWKGKRPQVRGMAKNHHDHPMGGGEGTSKGNRPPAASTGVLSKGGRTRKPGKPSAKRIIRRRTSKRFGKLKVK